MIRILGVLSLVLAAAGIAHAERPTNSISSFGTAKAEARDNVYLADPALPITFYCRCFFTPRDNASGGDVHPGDCGFTTPGSQSKGRTLEWEHVMPAQKVAGHRACWTNDGFGGKCQTNSGSIVKNRDCCERAGVDDEARHAINDLHNLVPSIGTLNLARLNHPYGEVAGEVRTWGACDFEVGGSPKVAEPAEYLRGNVARIWLYMVDTWDVPLTQAEIDQLLALDSSDPISKWERERDRRIEA